MDPKHSRLRDFPVAFVAETNEEAQDSDPFYSTDEESEFSTGVHRGSSDNSAMVKKAVSVSRPPVKGAAMAVPPTSEDAMTAAIAAMESGDNMLPEMASFLARKCVDRKLAAAEAAKKAEKTAAEKAVEESTRAAAKKAAQASLVLKPSVNVWGGGSDGIEASPTVVDDDADWVVSDERARDAGNGRMIHEATLIQRGRLSREAVRDMTAALAAAPESYNGSNGGAALNNDIPRNVGNTGNAAHGGTAANNSSSANVVKDKHGRSDNARFEQYPQYSLLARSGIPEPKKRREQRLKLQELPVTPPPRNKAAPRMAPQKELPERPKAHKVVQAEIKPAKAVYHSQVQPPAQQVHLKQVQVKQVQVHHVQAERKSEHGQLRQIKAQTLPQIRPRVQTPKKLVHTMEVVHDEMVLDTPNDNKARDHKTTDNKVIEHNHNSDDHMAIDDKARDVEGHDHEAGEPKANDRPVDENKAVDAPSEIDYADARARHIARWVLDERHRYQSPSDDGRPEGIALGSGGKRGVDVGIADGATEVTTDRLQWPTLLRDPTVNNDKLPATEPTGALHRLRMSILTSFAERCRKEHGNGGDDHKDKNGFAVPLCDRCLAADAFTMRPQHGHLFLDSVLLPMAEAITYAEMVMQVNTAVVERVFEESGLGESHDTAPGAISWGGIRVMPIYADYQRALVLATHRRRLFDELPLTVDGCGLLTKGGRK